MFAECEQFIVRGTNLFVLRFVQDLVGLLTPDLTLPIGMCISPALQL